MGAIGDVSATKCCCGVGRDIWRDRGSKDLTGWRGPGDVVDDPKQHEGEFGVERAGRTLVVPLNGVRPHHVESFYAGERSVRVSKF